MVGDHLQDPHAEKRQGIFHRILQAQPGSPVVKPNRALALTEDNRVVDHTDEEAAYVLCGEHSTLPKDVADELGIEEKALTPEEQAASDERRYGARGNFGPQAAAEAAPAETPAEATGEQPAETPAAELAAPGPTTMSFGGKKK